MLAALIKPLLSVLTGNLLGRVEGIFESYFKKEITKAELETRLKEQLLQSVAAVESVHAETLAKTFDSFMKASEKSLLLRIGWASVVFSQLAVLLWHQAGIPLLCYLEGVKACYPSSGSTVEWAYALLGGAIGLGPVVLRAGPAGATPADALRKLIGK